MAWKGEHGDQLFSFSQSNSCGTKYVMMMSAPEKPHKTS